MRMFDEALQRPEEALVLLPLDHVMLQRFAAEQPEAVPLMMRGMVRGVRRVSDGERRRSRFAERLAGLSEEEREEALLEAVRKELASVLGLSGPEQVPADRPLQELGLDSLMAVETRNRLATLIGQDLPASLLFDSPTPRALASHLNEVGRVNDDRESASESYSLRRAIEVLERTPLTEFEDNNLLQRVLALTLSLRARHRDDLGESTSSDVISDEDLDKLLEAEITKLS